MLYVIAIAQNDKNPGHLQIGQSVVVSDRDWDTYGKAKPSYKTMVFFEYVVMGADTSVSIGFTKTYIHIDATYLRTQGKALVIEIRKSTLVMMPVAITAGCCIPRYRMISTIL